MDAVCVPGENELVQFQWQRIGKHQLVLILHDAPDRAADVVTKIMKRHQFHQGDIFTHEPAKYQPHFLYACQAATLLETSGGLPDIVHRQAAHAPIEPRIPARCKEQLNQFDDATRDRVLALLEPMHYLPKKVFGATMPADVFALCNEFLLIPDAYLVLHHCLPEDGKLSKHAKQALLPPGGPKHRLLRLVTAPLASAAKLPPAALLQACDYLLLFPSAPHMCDDNKVQRRRWTRTLFTRAQLDRVLRTPDDLDTVLMQVFADSPRQGLVLDLRRYVDAADTAHAASKGMWRDVDTHRVFWTTDIVRPLAVDGA